MKLKIVNKRKFRRMIIILLGIILFLVFIGFNKTYSKTEITYKEQYVCQGDTLWSIVKNEYGTNQYLEEKDIRDVIQEVKALNNISDGNLEIGQKILIPSI